LTRRPLAVAIAIAVGARIFVALATMLWPVPNELGQPISPLHANSAIDFTFYQGSRDYYVGLARELLAIAEAPGAPTTESAQLGFVSAPVIPALLFVFGYDKGNTLPLSSLYVLASCALVSGWLWWLHHRGLSFIWLCLFSLLPTPFWFMLNVSSDLPFACALAVVFFLLCPAKGVPRMWGGLLAAIVASLIRPNGLVLLLFVLLFWLQRSRLRTGQDIAAAMIATTLGIALFLFYQDYGSDFLASQTDLAYFGILPGGYAAGLFPGLPDFVNFPLSWGAFAGAKLLYLVGLRPSWANPDFSAVALRALPGFIMLPGLVYAIIAGDKHIRVLLGLYLIPFLIGVSQERYLLAVQPILFYFAVRAVRDLVCGRKRRLIRPNS